jgi:2-methylcitrate dehydratase PrpD
MRVNTSVTQELAEFLAETEPKDIPEEAREAAKLCVLDLLGSVLVGYTSAIGIRTAAFVREMGGAPEATLFGQRLKTPVISAAFANGTAGHCSEIDDYHGTDSSIAGHIGAVVVPSTLAIGELVRRGGQHILEAIILGYETSVRISRVLGPSHYRLGWHSTSTIGTFAGAAAAGRVLELDKDKMVNALGLGGEEASGFIECFSSDAKPLHAGRAARSGTQAAVLAHRGFTGSRAILEGKNGFCRLTSLEFHPEEIHRFQGGEYAILSNSFKIYSCACFDAVDVALKTIIEHDIKPEDVEEVVIGTTSVFAANQTNIDPRTVTAAKTSTEYCVAVAVLDRQVSIEQFSSERLWDPAVREVMKKVKVRADEEVERLVGLGHYSAKALIRTRRGARYDGFIQDTKGYFRNPLSKADLQSKFKRLTSRALASDRADGAVAFIDRMDKVSDISELHEIIG